MKFLKHYQLNSRNVKDHTIALVNDAVIIDNTAGILVPRGKSSQRPDQTVNGYIRYNEDSNLFEFYQNNAWINITALTQITASNNYQVNSARQTISDTSTTVLDSFTIFQLRTISYTVQVVSGSNITVFHLDVVQNDTDAIMVRYLDNSITTQVLGEFDVLISGNNVSFVFTPYVLGTTVTLFKEYIPVSYNSSDPVSPRDSSLSSWVGPNDTVISVDNYSTTAGHKLFATIIPSVIDRFNINDYRSGNYKVQSTSGFHHQSIEFNIMHDGTNVYIMDYLDLRTPVSGTADTIKCGTISATINAGYVEITYTPNISNVDVIFSSGLIAKTYQSTGSNWITSHSSMSSDGFTTNSTNSTIISTFNLSNYKSGLYQIQLSSGTQHQTTELALTHNGSTIQLQQFYNNTVGTNGFGVFDANIVSNNIEVTFTPNTSSTINGIFVLTLLGA